MSDNVIVALISAAALLMVPVVTHFARQIKAKKMYEGVMRGLEATRAIYGLLHEINHTTSAQRVILFAGHNSGGVPRPHSPFFVTALHWICRTKEQAAMVRDYQGLIVDAHYVGMLLDLERQGKMTIKVQHMPDSQLKQIYESEGVSEALLFFVAITENKFLYLSVAKYSGSFDVNEVTRINLKVMKMRPHCVAR